MRAIIFICFIISAMPINAIAYEKSLKVSAFGTVFRDDKKLYQSASSINRLANVGKEYSMAFRLYDMSDLPSKIDRLVFRRNGEEFGNSLFLTQAPPYNQVVEYSVTVFDASGFLNLGLKDQMDKSRIGVNAGTIQYGMGSYHPYKGFKEVVGKVESAIKNMRNNGKKQFGIAFHPVANRGFNRVSFNTGNYPLDLPLILDFSFSHRFYHDGDEDFTISWDKVPGAAYYKLYTRINGNLVCYRETRSTHYSRELKTRFLKTSLYKVVALASGNPNHCASNTNIIAETQPSTYCNQNPQSIHCR